MSGTRDPEANNTDKNLLQSRDLLVASHANAKATAAFKQFSKNQKQKKIENEGRATCGKTSITRRVFVVLLLQLFYTFPH